MNGLQIVVCVEYLMQLKDFFINGMPAASDSSPQALPASASKPGIKSKVFDYCQVIDDIPAS
jgi:hypothetical protein